MAVRDVAHVEDRDADRPAFDVVAGRAVNVKEAVMERAKTTLPLLAILFLAMLSNGERFGHIAKAQTVGRASCCSNPKPRLCLRCSAEGYARCEAVKAGLRCLGSDVQECHLQNRPISRSGGKGGKTEIG